ncbi:TctB family tripartite tricarboxylate transporter protein (plasmid) [Rhizobium gallicum]|uniref:TctB family tripartite tricarboxylate transporter protein n=1 Tax=Rhizobium gallicum TaxID=56730 RepID=A0A1L5NW65_9HYPH|nr:tripartite tricarboxylate transporter TctB family protein [Rhizobium gallicum]APO72116.1 TctB family tripartite tricarboxylate transporter protein [Rhizobium gallicum]
MHIKRIHMELVAATLTAGIGLLAATGSLDLGVGWESSGPQPGYFPFYVGLIVLLASVASAAQTLFALRRHGEKRREIFLEAEQVSRLASFFLPMAVFVVVAIQLGLYVGSALYLFYVSWRQGKYHPLAAVSFGLGFAVALYLIFEIVFQIPLHKGPLENMFGVY